jgi:PAS domain S-box-containing protein
MFKWRQILQPISVVITSSATIQEVLCRFNQEDVDIIFVVEEEKIKGYIDKTMLLKQIENSSDLHEPIQYREDLLKVPLDHIVEFYHNISIYVGTNEQEELAWYCTVQEAHHRIRELQLTHMNQLLDGAGIAIITTNALLEITFINEMAEKILGLSSSFMMNRNYKSLLRTTLNLDDVLAGKHFVSVDSYLNFKHMIGNFTPLIVNGKIEGLVHIFFSREQWEEAVQELEFVRHLNEDLQAIYSSSHEQIMVVDPQGIVMRLTGSFLKDFWEVESPEQIIGRNVKELEEQWLIRPNIIEICLKQGKKTTGVQEAKNGRHLWSVATPVYHDGKITKIVVVSRDITEVNQLREKLVKVQRESEEYKQELDALKSHKVRKKELIYRSQKMERVVDEIRHVAGVDSTVLLYGESGVGKEVIAHAIHDWSKRHNQRFVRVNCGAIPESLIESELFGYEKGAFTGADSKGKPGLFEMAHEGTIFLDEIGELPLNMQVKLLRILQEREITRVGGTKNIPLDVRIITATNRNLWELVQEGNFREDLYYRLNVIPIYIPPLRNRKEDIIPLSLHFLQQFNYVYQKEKNLSPSALEVMENYPWYGNVRELQNVIERLVVTSREDFISRDDVLSVLYTNHENKGEPAVTLKIMPLKKAIAELESQLISLALEKYGTAAKAAEVLEISRATISRRINKLLK